jgi:hypothetical protein
MRRARRGLALVVGCLGGFCGAIVLSILLAHPASATVAPSSGGDPIAGAVAGITNTIASTTTELTTPAATIVGPIARPVMTTLTPALVPVGRTVAPILRPASNRVTSGLAPVLQVVSPAVSPAVSPVVAVLQPVLAPVGQTITLLPNPVAGPSSAPTLVYASRSRFPGGTLTGTPRWSTLGAPDRRPKPTPPVQRFPVLLTASTVDGSSQLYGSSPLAGLPPLGLLLPALLVSGVILGRRRSPRLLLDLRYSPPG